MTSTLIRVEDPSAVGEARRVATALAEKVGFDETTRGKIAIVVTELGTNIERHGRGGYLLLRAVDDVTGRYFETLACDKGPGMPDVDAALRDGFSTGGSAGEGLGAVARLSTVFDLYSAVGEGTVVLSRIGTIARGPCTIGVVSVPFPGELVCGDAYRLQRDGARVRVSVIDGLGHGKGAFHAATEALTAVDRNAHRGLVAVIDDAHGALRATRGAAIGVADFDFIARKLEWAGVGNIAGSIIGPNGQSKSVVSHNGIVGHTVRRVQPFQYEWPVDGTAVIYSDGIATSWNLANYRGSARKHPAVLAALLYRDWNRGRDDATVVVLRDGNVGGHS